MLISNKLIVTLINVNEVVSIEKMYCKRPCVHEKMSRKLKCQYKVNKTKSFLAL